MSSSSNQARQVGLLNPRPYYTVERDPIEPNILKKLDPDTRTALIVRRANYYSQIMPPPYTFGKEYNWAKSDATEGKAYSMSRPTRVLEFPVEKVQILSLLPSLSHSNPLYRKLRDMFPLTPDLLEERDGCIEARQQESPNVGALWAQFNATIARFKSTLLCNRIKELARSTFSQVKCNKIVAFGGYGISAPPTMVKRMQTQHAALLAIREVWKETNQGDFPIYLQDPQYLAMDQDVAAKCGMQILNGDFSHQMGWAKIDDSTLVVDLSTVFPIYELIFEIGRPAALFTPGPIDSNSTGLWVDQPYSLTLQYDRKEIVVPYLGR